MNLELKALCVTEAEGTGPRAIRIRLTPASGGPGLVLTGAKRFVTGADSADWLLVAASLGADDAGRNRIGLVGLARRSPGVEMTPLPSLRFVPEIAHAAVSFDRVRLTDAALFPGDGWTGYVKPFRTVEDIHVMAAVTGHLIGLGRRWGWPAPTIEKGLALAIALRALAAADRSSPATHLVLGGILALLDRWLDCLEGFWPDVDQIVSRRWQRDRPLLKIAAAARIQRLSSARGKFFA